MPDSSCRRRRQISSSQPINSAQAIDAYVSGSDDPDLQRGYALGLSILNRSEDNPAAAHRMRAALSQTDISKFESPIESLIGLTLICEFSVFSGLDFKIEYGHEWPFDIPSNSIIFAPQCQVSSFRVDFLIAARRDDKYPVAVTVECDGHDFHERTKEQARRDRSRDRAIQAMGIPAMRFTGREIFGDPEVCSREVYDMVLRMGDREYDNR